MSSVKTYGDATNEETSSSINDLYPPLREQRAESRELHVRRDLKWKYEALN